MNEFDPTAPMIVTEYQEDGTAVTYDFSSGVRGKHFQEMRRGYRVTLHNEDGSTTLKEYEPDEGWIALDPDVRRYFPDSESVNRTLRSLIALIPEHH